MIDKDKLGSMEAEAKYAVGAYGDSWSPGYVKARAAETLELIEEVRKLRELVKTAPFEEGDIVREVGEEEPTGEIIQVKHPTGGGHETAYLVKLYKPYPGFKSITYYADEIELIERPGK